MLKRRLYKVVWAFLRPRHYIPNEVAVIRGVHMLCQFQRTSRKARLRHLVALAYWLLDLTLFLADVCGPLRQRPAYFVEIGIIERYAASLDCGKVALGKCLLSLTSDLLPILSTGMAGLCTCSLLLEQDRFSVECG